MTAEKLLERLKKFYMSTFDLEESHSVVRNSDAESAEREEREFALYGHFNVDNSRYVCPKRQSCGRQTARSIFLWMFPVRVDVWTEGDFRT